MHEKYQKHRKISMKMVSSLKIEENTERAKEGG